MRIEAINDTADYEKDSPAITIDVLKNDHGSNLHLLFVWAESGEVSITADGKISYKAHPWAEDSDVIHYWVGDGIQEAEGLVNVDILEAEETPLGPSQPGNGTEPPIPLDVVNDAAVYEMDAEPITIDVLANDQGSGLRITGVWAEAGSVHITDDGQLSYTAYDWADGSDVIHYWVGDENFNEAEGLVTVEILGPGVTQPETGNPGNGEDPGTPSPIAAVTDTAEYEIGAEAITIDVLANDEGSNLRITGVWAEAGSVHITDDGQLSYTAYDWADGNDIIHYWIADDTSQEVEGIVHVNVTGEQGSGSGSETPFPPTNSPVFTPVDWGQPPASAAGAPSLGINLGDVSDWSVLQPFLDVFKLSRPWMTGRDYSQWDTQGTLDLDESGWIVSLPDYDPDAPQTTGDGSAYDYVHTIIFTNDHDNPTNYEDGRYVIRYDGEGTLEVENATIVSQEDGRIVIDYDDSVAYVRLKLLSTDPNNTGNYIRNIEVVKEEYEALLDAGEIFHPRFLETVDDFRAFRFMDWMSTNIHVTEMQDRDFITDWSDRNSPDDARWVGGDGIPVEILVELANKAGIDPWFTFQFGASDEYMVNFATYVRDNLDPDLHAYFEYSNEVWNFSFAQAQLAHTLGQELLGSDVPDAWRQYYGIQASNMANILDTVYNNDPGDQMSKVFGGFIGDSHGAELAALLAPDWVAMGGDRPIDAGFDVYAVTGYFGVFSGETWDVTQPDGSVVTEPVIQQFIDAGEQGIVDFINYLRTGEGLVNPNTGEPEPYHDHLMNLRNWFSYHYQVAEQYGMELVGYEGGQHLSPFFETSSNQEVVDFLVAAQHHPDMAFVYEDMLSYWREAGGTLMVLFNSHDIDDRWGSWGLWNDMWEDHSVKGDAAINFSQNETPWWGDARGTNTFADNLTVIGREGDETLTGGAGDDFFYDLSTSVGIIEGGDGHDRVLLDGTHDEIDVSYQTDGTVLVILPSGREYIMNSVEQLQFSNGLIVDI